MVRGQFRAKTYTEDSREVQALKKAVREYHVSQMFHQKLYSKIKNIFWICTDSAASLFGMRRPSRMQTDQAKLSVINAIVGDTKLASIPHNRAAKRRQ